MQSSNNLQPQNVNQKEVEKSWLCLNLDQKAFINSFTKGFNFQKKYLADVYLGDTSRIRWQGLDAENGSFWMEGKTSIDNISSQEITLSSRKSGSLKDFLSYLSGLKKEILKDSKLLFKTRISTLITRPNLTGQAIEGKIEFDQYLPIQKIYPGFVYPHSFILDTNSEVNNICKVDIEIINSGQNSEQAIEIIFKILRSNIQSNFPQDGNPQSLPNFYELTTYEHLVQKYESLKKDFSSTKFLKDENQSEVKSSKLQLPELFYKTHKLEHNLVYLMKYGGKDELFKMAFLRITNPKIYETELQKYLKEQREKERKEFKFEKIPDGFKPPLA